MSAALRPMSLTEFLAWEREQELRYEFDGAGPHAMTGGTLRHSIIASNLLRALEDRLQGRPCRVFRGDVKVLVAGRIRYPDVVVSCADAELGTDIAAEPVVVVEVLSPSTARVDRVVKFAEYRATASIRHYVMLEQDEVAATLNSRQGEQWIVDLLRGDAMLDLLAIGVSVPLPLLYRGVTFSSSPG